VWGWRNFVAAACRRRRRRCCRLTPSPSSSSYLSAPEVFSLLAFNLRSRARAASSTAVRSFFRSFCRSFRASRLRFWCSIIAVRFVQSFVYPLRLTSPPTGIHALSWVVGLSEKLCKQFVATCFDFDFPPSVCPPLECLSRFLVYLVFALLESGVSRCADDMLSIPGFCCWRARGRSLCGRRGSVCRGSRDQENLKKFFGEEGTTGFHRLASFVPCQST